jgi:hypothetical protein
MNADACEEDGMDECAKIVENVLKYVNYVLGLRITHLYM